MELNSLRPGKRLLSGLLKPACRTRCYIVQMLVVLLTVTASLLLGKGSEHVRREQPGNTDQTK